MPGFVGGVLRRSRRRRTSGRALAAASALFAAALDDSTVNLPMADQKALWALYLQHVEDMGPEIGHLWRCGSDAARRGSEDAAAGCASFSSL